MLVSPSHPRTVHRHCACSGSCCYPAAGHLQPRTSRSTSLSAHRRPNLVARAVAAPDRSREEAAPAVLSALVALSEPDGLAVSAEAASPEPQQSVQQAEDAAQVASTEVPETLPPRRGRGRPRKTSFEEVKKPPRRSANSVLRSLKEGSQEAESSLELGLRAVKSGTKHGEAIRKALFQNGGRAEEERLKKRAMLHIAGQLSRRLETAIDDLHEQTLHMEDADREAHLRALLCEAGGLLNRTKAVVSRFSADIIAQ